MAGHRLCTSPHHRGPRWTLCIFFHANGWDEEGEQPLRWQSRCQACQRVENRIRKGIAKRGRPYEKRKPGMTEEERIAHRAERRKYATVRMEENKGRRRRYHDRTDPRLPVGPLQDWLTAKLLTATMSELARMADVDRRRLVTIRDGKYVKGGKTYDLKHVRLSFIERVIGPHGDVLGNLYDRDLVALYDASYHDDRNKPRGVS